MPLVNLSLNSAFGRRLQREFSRLVGNQLRDQSSKIHPIDNGDIIFQRFRDGLSVSVRAHNGCSVLTLFADTQAFVKEVSYFNSAPLLQTAEEARLIGVLTLNSPDSVGIIEGAFCTALKSFLDPTDSELGVEALGGDQEILKELSQRAKTSSAAWEELVGIYDLASDDASLKQAVLPYLLEAAFEREEGPEFLYERGLLEDVICRVITGEDNLAYRCLRRFLEHHTLADEVTRNVQALKVAVALADRGDAKARAVLRGIHDYRFYVDSYSLQAPQGKADIEQLLRKVMRHLDTDSRQARLLGKSLDRLNEGERKLSHPN
jgi:hypothetical protein